MRDRGLDRSRAAGFHRAVVHPPRQIYASTADRRHGRRWNGVAGGRRRSLWVPAVVLAAAAVAGEALRNLA